jgi:hypothetical protein
MYRSTTRRCSSSSIENALSRLCQT